MGSGIKAPVPSEIANMAVARKSIVAATTITKGTTFTAEHLAVKRPGTGRSPFELWDVIGTVATRDYAIDETIE